MYEGIKKIAKAIVPTSIINKHEESLRKLITFTYKGNKYQCNICEQKLSKFVKLNNGQDLCPNCGCLPRTRRLFAEISKLDHLDSKSILHFSPPKSFRKKLSSLNLKNYITTDYEGEFDADKKLNIEAISEPDNQYDIIICYHVLEHISKDQLAMNELFRILKPNGTCYIQTPFKSGEIYENDAIISKQERLKHFGQDDHVRIYSANGIKNRLEKAGFKIEINKLELSSENKNGFAEGDLMIKAKKTIS